MTLRAGSLSALKGQTPTLTQEVGSCSFNLGAWISAPEIWGCHFLDRRRQNCTDGIRIKFYYFTKGNKITNFFVKTSLDHVLVLPTKRHRLKNKKFKSLRDHIQKYLVFRVHWFVSWGAISCR